MTYPPVPTEKKLQKINYARLHQFCKALTMGPLTRRKITLKTKIRHQLILKTEPIALKYNLVEKVNKIKTKRTIGNPELYELQLTQKGLVFVQSMNDVNSFIFQDEKTYSNFKN
jgi:hypothetical protein